MTVPTQSNYGSGPLIGRDNYGNIEMVDAKTKALLKKMTEQSPDLANLLTRALDDGVISPDMVQELGYATRNLNEDVASMITRAADNLNLDVANSLNRAADTSAETLRLMGDRASAIDEAIEQLSRVTLSDDVKRLQSVSDSLGRHAQRIEHVTTPLPPEVHTNWKAVWIALIIGVVLGATIVSLGMNNGSAGEANDFAAPETTIAHTTTACLPQATTRCNARR
ncbi:hypothetical protein FB566_1715 [Stackebrandtia endophytica]|uniref:Uncharacterized protein n=1 Tax=Stackebrandtia endophytica TaxID=1496996 RepID=A0A543AUD5_9ACTN|nr:hypothetical protein [Stackebrandtia endophytica]TQL76193.1 hypothetical protein FB566_1715 [Stackebrandtia endophytica]